MLYIRVCCIDERVPTFGVCCGDDPVPFSFISDICYVDNLVIRGARVNKLRRNSR